MQFRDLLRENKLIDHAAAKKYEDNEAYKVEIEKLLKVSRFPDLLTWENPIGADRFHRNAYTNR